MKAIYLWVTLCLLASMTHGAYDFSHHESGDELKETLINEPQSIFVIFFFKTATMLPKRKRLMI